MQLVIVWVLMESHRWPHRQGCHIFANMDIDNEQPLWGFKDTAFIRREKVQPLRNSPTLLYREQERGGIGDYEHNIWATKLLQDWDCVVWIWSMQLLMAPAWMTVTLPDHFEICFRCYESPFSCADLSHSVLFPAWSRDKIHASAQQAWLPLFYNLYFCLLFPSRLGIQHYTTVSYS